MELVLLAVALAMGVDLRRLALLALALFFPWGFAVLLTVLARVARRRADGRSTRFLEGVAAELRSGSSLRQALSASATAVGEPGLASDAMESSYLEMGERAGAVFPEVGREISLTIASAAGSGTATARLFDELASLAMARDEVRREVRVAAAPGRVAAGLFLAAPTLYLGHRWTSGDLAALLSAPGQRVAAVAGLALFLTGLVGVAIVLWRAR